MCIRCICSISRGCSISTWKPAKRASRCASSKSMKFHGTTSRSQPSRKPCASSSPTARRATTVCTRATSSARCATADHNDSCRMVPWLGPDDPFPPVERALSAASGAPGLLAASADLLPSRLIDAYRRGIFPWYSDGQPVLWWTPDPRMVLFPAEFKVSDSLRKTLKRVVRDPVWEIRVDDDFSAVMRACADTPRDGQRGTWITTDIVDAYTTLHRAGSAHSIETWHDGVRVGGLYGVSFGRM